MKEEPTLEGFIEKLQEVVFERNSQPILKIFLQKNPVPQWTSSEIEAYRIGLQDALEIVLRKMKEYSEKKEESNE